MKSIIFSLSPSDCELLAKGKLRLLLSKVKPQIEGNFKVYFFHRDVKSVVGEATCVGFKTDEYYKDDLSWNMYWGAACRTKEELCKYAGSSGTIWGWHITNVGMYQKPKELSDFRKPCDYDLGCKCCSMYFPGTAFAEPRCKNGSLEVSKHPIKWQYAEPNKEFKDGDVQYVD